MKSIIIRVITLIMFIFTGSVFVFSADQPVIPANNSEVFVKYSSAWFYNDSGDLGKDFKNVNAKNKTLMYFGNKVTVLGNKKVGDSIYINVLLPDGSKCWAPLDYLVIKFIVITDKDIKTFSQPDESYINKVKLQPCFLGYLVKEKGSFLNVDFYHYAPPKKAGDNPVWIGNVWIKTAYYTDNIIAAKQANALKMAYNELYGKTQNKANALKYLKDGLDSTGEAETPVVQVLKDLIVELESENSTQSVSSVSNKPDKIVGTYYTPSTEGLRFRESPSLDGKYIRTLQKGESLKLLEIGNQEQINGITGKWCKFEDSNGQVGWCFDAYITEMN
jgi:hypothetical protein